MERIIMMSLTETGPFLMERSQKISYCRKPKGVGEWGEVQQGPVNVQRVLKTFLCAEEKERRDYGAHARECRKTTATSRFSTTSQGQDSGEQEYANVDDEVDYCDRRMDLALNVYHIFEADECDAFDSDVDEGPNSQTIYMTFINANVLSNFVSLQCLSSLLNALLQNTMAEQNVPAQPPTRTDEQIVPRSQWLTIGKSNLLFNAQKIQKNPIFQISVDILRNTNFFQALTASANVPAIYLQQFWKTMSYNEKTGVYSCQLDEQWFDLSADLLRKALAITPVNPAHPFELPPSGDTVLDFVNELGYPEPVE
ncbi:hypothetical protein Tco_1168646, partial [Tanacetum coccineum]